MGLAVGTPFAAAGAIAGLVGVVGLVNGILNLARNFDTMTAIKYNESLQVSRSKDASR